MLKYYKTYVVGIDDTFEITTNKINDSIGLSNKKAYAKIIVKQYHNDFIEIVTGKKYKAVIMKDENEATIPNSSTFVIDDRKTNNKRMHEANAEDIKTYLVHYIDKRDSYLELLNNIDDTCNSYLKNAKNKRKR